MDDEPESRPRLGSLAQSARSKNLKSARWILIVVGLLNLGFNLFIFFMIPNLAVQQVEEERKKLAPGMVLDPARLEQEKQTFIRTNQLNAGGFIALGAALIVLGIAVYQIPVAATVLGLILYIGGSIITVAMTGDASMLWRGILIRILIIIGLFKAVQSAIAYEREKKAGAV